MFRGHLAREADVTDGPVQLYVVDALKIGAGAQVTLTPAEAASDWRTITALQTTLLPIRAQAQVVGTLLAPQAVRRHRGVVAT